MVVFALLLRRFGSILPLQVELYQFLQRTLAGLRGLTLLALLAITLLEPLTEPDRLPNWVLVLLFAFYDLLLEYALRRRPVAQGHQWRAGLLLAGAGAVYVLGADPTGPLFALMFLVVIYASAVLSARAGLAYTGLALVLAACIAPTLPLWTPTAHSVRTLGTQLVMLALAGLGTAILSRRLVLEEAQALAGQAEATRLAQIDRLRTEFISTISHDLRTPFTAARAGLGMVATSLAPRLAPEEAQLLGNVRRNVDWLGILINDLLAFNQLEAGVLRLDMQPLDLRTVVTEALAMVYPLIQQKGQTLEIDLPDPLPCQGDARRLEQVLVNLLANASRHTPAGTQIRIHGQRAAGQVCVAVRDDGPGIAPADQGVIFERFWQASAPTEGGAGLGLAIVRALVELHGGRVWVESRPPAGTTFYVELACAAEAPEPQES